MSLSEITCVFRIPGRNSPHLKFTTIARRNELIARIRWRHGLNASVAPIGRISICERTTASERRTFAEAHRLAACDIGRVWIRRGITYFRVKENTPSYHVTPPGFISLHSQVCFISVRVLYLSLSLSPPSLLPSLLSLSVSHFPVSAACIWWK